MHDENFSAALAENVRNLRTAQRLTQGQLAKKADIPRATLSLMESGTANPTLGVLLRVCNALGIRLEEVLQPPQNDTVVFRKGQLPARKRGGATVQKLLPQSLSGVEIEALVIGAGGTLVGVPHSPGTREYLVVRAGRVELAVEGAQFTLEAGDVAVFRGHQKHSYRSLGRSPVQAISVIAQGRE